MNSQSANFLSVMSCIEKKIMRKNQAGFLNYALDTGISPVMWRWILIL